MSARPSTRLVLVTHYYPSRRGGVEIVAGELIARLAAKGGVDCKWFASNLDAIPSAQPLVSYCPVQASDIVTRRFSLPYPLWSPRGLLRLAAAIRQADIVHLHDFLYMGSLVAMIAARLFRKPVVITQHIGAIPYDSRVLRGLLRLLNRTVGAWMLGRANQVAFVSASVMNDFLRFVRFRRTPKLIPNGVDTDIFRPLTSDNRQQARAAMGFTSARPILLFVGRFVEKKGLRLLHDLAKRLHRVQWVFVGHGPLDPAAWHLPNVRVLRGLSGRSLAPVYQTADLLVLPSYGEGFPLVVQEAMACGTPVLIGRETALGCPQGDQVMYSLELGQANAVAHWCAQIEQLLADPNALGAHRGLVAEFARSHWSWDECATSYYSIFNHSSCAR